MPNPFSKSNKMSLTDVFHFGKYAKEEFKEDGSKYTLKEIIEIDSNYISWCITNIKEFDIDQEADNYFQELNFEETCKLFSRFNKNQKNNTPEYDGLYDSGVDTGGIDNDIWGYGE